MKTDFRGKSYSYALPSTRMSQVDNMAFRDLMSVEQLARVARLPPGVGQFAIFL